MTALLIARNTFREATRDRLLAGIFVMGIIVYQINREFASLDTAHLSSLKE